MNTSINNQNFISCAENSQIDSRVQWCLDNLNSLYNSKETKCEIIGGKLVIYGDIVIPDEFEELPIKIDEVHGNVVLSNAENKTFGQLRSLKNFPTIIHGKFDCRMNPYLKTLEGGPETVLGSYWCNNCGLENLDGIATTIGGNILAFANKIKDINALKKTIFGGQVTLYPNPIVEMSDPYYLSLAKTRRIKQ